MEPQLELPSAGLDTVPAATALEPEAGVSTAPIEKRAPLKRISLRVLRERGIPVQTVLDVGVLYGTPELIDAYPNVTHILFEPVAEFRAHIEANYAGIPHRLMQAAVSDRSGTTSLATTTILEGLEISHSYMTDDSHGARSVPMVSIDDYLEGDNADAPFFLKIDVDGAELKVLNGAKKTLSRTSVVMIEATVGSLVERLSFLIEAGFRLFDLTEPCYYDDGLWQCDAILVRNDIYSEKFADIGRDFDESKWKLFT